MASARETIFTLDYEVKRMNHRILRLGGRLHPGFERIRRIRRNCEVLQGEAGIPHAEFVYLPDIGDEGIVLLRFPIVFKCNEKRDRILAELKKRG